jgi:hypothetical protein
LRSVETLNTSEYDEVWFFFFYHSTDKRRRVQVRAWLLLGQDVSARRRSSVPEMNIGKLDNLALEKVALEVTLNVPSALNRREASIVAKKQAKTTSRSIWKELKNKKLKHLEI